MGYIKDLEEKVQNYTSGDYEIVETSQIPSASDVEFGKKAYKTKLTSFCIDLRKSTDLLVVHDKQTCGKIHKSFLTIATKIIFENGGQLRSFNGDSALAFWPAQYKHQIESAVRAAFQLKWALDIRFSKYFEQYSKLDFGIGIDWGEVYIVRAGLPRNDDNNDLVFLGMCVNFSTAIANQAKGPNHIEISKSTYDNLTEGWLIGTNNNGQKVNMWSTGSVNWKQQLHETRCTTWYQKVNE